MCGFRYERVDVWGKQGAIKRFLLSLGGRWIYYKIWGGCPNINVDLLPSGSGTRFVIIERDTDLVRKQLFGCRRISFLGTIA